MPELLDLSDPQAPHYWMHETSGVLAGPVQRYFEGEALSDADIGALRAYLRQWIGSPVWDADPHVDEHGRNALQGLRDLIDSLTNREQISRWVQQSLEIGIDPF